MSTEDINQVQDKVINQKKSKVTIPETDIEDINSGKSTIKQVAEKHDTSYQNVYNRVKKGKLKVNFTQDTSESKKFNLTDEQLQDGQQTADYTDVTKGFWQSVDGLLRVIASFKLIDYEGLAEQEIESITESSKAKLGKYMVGNDAMSWFIAVGYPCMKIGSKIKIHKKVKDVKTGETKNITPNKVIPIKIQPVKENENTPPTEIDKQESPENIANIF